MDLSFRHDLWWARLPRSPRDRGTVERLVVRTGAPGEGARAARDEVQVEPGVGVVGDSFARDPGAQAGAEVSLVNVHVARSVSQGDAERSLLTGDNLQVDLDLSEENLPVGTRLAVGTALLEVSEAVHRPCRSFVRRFGALAAKRVARANRVGRRGRGVLCRVVEAGVIRLGDPVEVRRT